MIDWYLPLEKKNTHPSKFKTRKLNRLKVLARFRSVWFWNSCAGCFFGFAVLEVEDVAALPQRVPIKAVEEDGFEAGKGSVMPSTKESTAEPCAEAEAQWAAWAATNAVDAIFRWRFTDSKVPWRGAPFLLRPLASPVLEYLYWKRLP